MAHAEIDNILPRPHLVEDDGLFEADRVAGGDASVDEPIDIPHEPSHGSTKHLIAIRSYVRSLINQSKVKVSSLKDAAVSFFKA